MNPFRMSFFSLIVISLAFTIVEGFSPDGRIGQASVLTGSKLYFFGGYNKPQITDQVVYLNLSTSFSITSPSWDRIISPIPIPLFEAMPCLSIDGSNVFLVGGLSMNTQNSSLTYPPSFVYEFDFNNLQWTTPDIDNFNKTFVGRTDTEAVADNNGKCYIFGGFQENLTITNSNSTTNTDFYYNDMNIFDTKAMKWSTLILSNAPLARATYSAVIKDNLIYYIGGTSNSSIIDITEIPVFDTTNLKWFLMNAKGDSITARYGHSAVLSQDGLIIIYGGQGKNGIQPQPDVALLNVGVSPYMWTAIKDKAPRGLKFHSASIYGRYMIVAFGVIVPSQPQKPNSSLTLNSDLYILNTQDYTWINYFDASNIYGPNNSLSLGAKIGISIAVIVALVVIVITGFFIYKKFHVRNNYRNSIATPGTSHIDI